MGGVRILLCGSVISGPTLGLRGNLGVARSANGLTQRTRDIGSLGAHQPFARRVGGSFVWKEQVKCNQSGATMKNRLLWFRLEAHLFGFVVAGAVGTVHHGRRRPMSAPRFFKRPTDFSQSTPAVGEERTVSQKQQTIPQSSEGG